MPLRIPRPLFEEVGAHANECFPGEAVGLLAGDLQGRVRRVLRLPNLTGPRAFLADPYAQFQAEREMQREGLALLAIYHTHPGGCAHLSEADHAFAAPWRCLHVVVSVSAGGIGDLRAYDVTHGEVREVGIVLEAEVA